MSRSHNGYDYWLVRTGGPDVDQWPLRPSDTMLQAIEQATEQAGHHQELVVPGLTEMPPSKGLAVTRCLADVEPEPIRWLWPGRIARGKLTLTVGDPGLGKSFLTLDIAARVSTGAAWPDRRSNRQGSVILLSAEDDAGDTIRPRLDAMGADVSRIHVLDAVRHIDHDAGEASERMPTLGDTAALAEAIVSAGDVRLVIVDPVSAYLGQVDSHKNADLRALLSPLAKLAATYGVAVVAVSHLNKSTSSAIYRTMGSLAFTAAARAVWCVAKDKNDERRRLLIPVKNNIACDSGGLAYRIVGAEPGRIEWEPEPISITADDALNSEPDEIRSEREDAIHWLREVLADGPAKVKDLQQWARDAGHTWATVRRAKTALNVQATKAGFENSAWYWELPKVLIDAEGAHVIKRETVSTFAEDAQGAPLKSVSTFDKSEHLRGNAADVSAAIQNACSGLSISPERLRSMLADEDLRDIETGDLRPENLRALARALT
ncbi:MAG: AAA family ATPase [Gammaproteobacteria bacterium]